jgi:hypothetical protein
MMPTDRQRRKAAVWRLVVNSYPCPECHAAPGRACVTVRNVPKPEPHADRSREARARGWAFADAPARCYRCQRPLAGLNPLAGLCGRCKHDDERPNTHATKDNPGPDGSYDVPLFEE